MTNNITKQLSEIIRDYVNSRLLDVHTSMPGYIKSYNVVEQKAEIVPSFKRVFEDGTTQNLPVIANVPVFTLSGNNGNAFVSVPIKAGDRGLLFFSERSVEDYLSSNGNSQLEPGDDRIFDLSDAFFLIGFNPFQKAVPFVSAENVQVYNKEGDVEIKAVNTGKYIKIGNNPVENPVVWSELDAAMQIILAAIDLAAGTTTYSTWVGATAKMKCSKVKIPPYTEL